MLNFIKLDGIRNIRNSKRKERDLIYDTMDIADLNTELLKRNMEMIIQLQNDMNRMDTKVNSIYDKVLDIDRRIDK